MSPKVLVVDDNPINLKLSCELLEASDYFVARANNSEEAIEQIEKLHFDLILMDIEMPGMDGLSLTRRLKADELTREIPVIALTAFAMKGDEQKAIEAGCSGYITKPIDTRAFISQISKFLLQSGNEKKGIL
ncbi:two-component system response regulator [Leptospira perolatii]|uniref:Two-component system response regulator n=1 Tax=Leptospira perolatii TaxID=2023191 RepID=A0A2M9ZJV0_9LEPT|nr:response regulator [Leptospira perolatii]PJZ69476.1 two-component system response regulator [Leptospira perolatii]PJZ72301.1 two-component system response regulator [Leptospira perolatii]